MFAGVGGREFLTFCSSGRAFEHWKMASFPGSTLPIGDDGEQLCLDCILFYRWKFPNFNADTLLTEVCSNSAINWGLGMGSFRFLNTPINVS